jgi:uncharacterized protein YjbI with pentapeptide repeats
MDWRGRTALSKTAGEEIQPAKTLWDWLQLLIVPAILIGVTFAWSFSQTRSDNKREDRRIAADRVAAEQVRQDATLQTYLDQMSGLMLHEKLLTSEKFDAVRAVARTVTLATLRRLDGERKVEVVHFLYEAGLVDKRDSRVSLFGADLVGAPLKDAHLVFADLEGANLVGANLESADLRDARLGWAHLEGANLEDADFGNANLRMAYLVGANLGGAYLVGTNLEHADLGNARLKGAHFKGAHLRGAHLKGAHLEGAHLEDAKNLNLGRFIAGLPLQKQKAFLDSEKVFLDSLSPEELARFNLSPEQLARLRREAHAA